jgi:hypothetical protein
MAGGLIGQRRDVQAAQGHVAAAPAIVVSELVGAVRGGDVDRHDHQVRPVIGGERHDVLVLEHDLIIGVEVSRQRYGDPELPWSRARDALAAEPPGPEITFFLGTSRPDGRPHAAGVGAIWDEGELYFTSGAGTRKARNLAANPACTISVKLEGIDLGGH